MNDVFSTERASIVRWVWACLLLFFVMGLGFGTWLSRLPTLRDDLGASMVQMSVYGLCLAAGSLAGLLFAGPLIERFEPRRTMAVMVAVLVVALPSAAALMAAGALVVGLAVLFLFGFCFSTTDIAMNVSGANAERAEGRSRMPLLHACYSIGGVVSMLVGAVAEALRVPLVPHFIAISALIAVCTLVALRMVPMNESALRQHAESLRHEGGEGEAGEAGDAGQTSQAGQAILETSAIVPVIESPVADDLATATSSIPIISQPAESSPTAVPASAPIPAAAQRKYSPWRDRRIVLIGVITLAAGLLEGAPADWLPLALVDGRGVANEFGTVMLGLFFGSVVISRLLGSALLGRFGRVSVLRVSFAVSGIGVLVVSLVPGPTAMVLGTIAWGLGTGMCWPITISASADNPTTAVRDVAAVSAVGYTSLLLGPMVFGFLGEHFGLLQAFLVLPVFGLLAILLAGVTRTRR